ncbi:two-component sensor histidine kinase [Salinicola sp. MH3R3-1]|uniref:ATP-binding protein n=1 Tax=Salinicola sp. MH3R3-1 TaxID=1928762 RepID=UPI00094E3675|nr:ATP-binding protein [Salinicola sp. MH3R3-1]OLO09486.1 two-component sensor histidine kinase [Salinicola sp. MH3R3-1]
MSLSLSSRRDWPRLSRLSIKLFAIILITNVLISGLVFVFVSRSLDEGFVNYLERSQSTRAETLANALGEQWTQRGSWQWLRDNPRAWQSLVRSQLWSSDRHPPTGIDRQLSDARGYVLLDELSNPVIGEPLLKPPPDDLDMPPPPEPHFVPIRSGDKLVGQLGYLPPERLMARMDQIFLERQQRNLTIIVGSLFLTSLLLAGGLAWWLGRRARLMTLATRRLTLGDYSVRLSERGRDELSRLSADFNQLAETLEANRRARQRWVADIAHELRTPLAVLRGEIEAMQDGVRPLSSDNLGSLQQEVDQLGHLVEDLRLLAQSDAGALDMHLVPVDLGESLEQRLDDSQARLEGHGLSLQLETESLWVRADNQRLRQLWDNLLSNTIAYTDSPGTLRVTLKRQDQRAEVTWEDTAPGVSDDELPRLTERLYRVEGSRNRRSGGSGLGLSIARALIEAQGGTLIPSTSSLGGLRWTLTFPLDLPDSVSTDVSSHVPAGSAAGSSPTRSPKRSRQQPSE